MIRGSPLFRASGAGIACAILAFVSNPVPAQVKQAKVDPPVQLHALSPTLSRPFPFEKYVFSVQWHFLNAGTSTVQIQHSGSGALITATAQSAGMPDKLYHVYDTFNAQVDSGTFCTLHISKHNQEGSRSRDYNIVLDYPRRKSEVDEKDLKTSQTKHSEFDIPPCVSDAISGFFYVASLPLTPGFTRTFPISDNGRTTQVQITVESRDKVKGPSGEFQTLRVKAEPISGAMKGKGVLWVWFSDDGRHIPVQMKSKLGFATLLFQLEKFQN
jgi:hypothetical protein